MMANKTNIEKAIRVMERAREHQDSFSMLFFQSPGEVICQTIAQLHRCGNTACFAGYIAISPEFREDGGDVNEYGHPVLHVGEYKSPLEGSEALEHWLGISKRDAGDFVYGGYDGGPFYGKPLSDVTPEDVIKKLRELL